MNYDIAICRRRFVIASAGLKSSDCLSLPLNEVKLARKLTTCSIANCNSRHNGEMHGTKLSYEEEDASVAGAVQFPPSAKGDRLAATLRRG
jgi:hypothetical protein